MPHAPSAFVRLAAATGLVLATATAAVAEPAFPFGSHRQPYAADALRLSRSQASVDAETARFYET